MIHIYTGDGKGKTTAAIGLAVRMAGYDKKILFVQFLKGSYTGELKLLENTPNITVIRCDKNYGFFKSMTDADKDSIKKCHNENLAYAVSHMNEFDMIVLDEIFAAVNYGLLDEETTKKIVESYTGELVLTGRDPDEWFTDNADYISEIKKQKHPYDKGIMAREGVEY